jgi:DNA invertase Pin-like site-specific DNA recombinase
MPSAADSTSYGTHDDNGKSVLRIDGRDALKQLLTDVESKSPGFKAILVYDVSRWGRFQDADESAYYEYICRRSGSEVRYCAEQFENDGSVASTIVKTVKRAMAGEYSRELSSKVFAGLARLIEMGFRQGGPAGYGLRRRLIDQNRNPKALLAFGERTSLQTDRVVLAPAPPMRLQRSAECLPCSSAIRNLQATRSPAVSMMSRSRRI